MEYFDAVGETYPVLVLFLWGAVFLAPRCVLVVAVASLWSAIFFAFAPFGRCLFRCSFACVPFLFPAARIWGREWENNLQSIGKVDAERQMVADAPVVERTEVSAEGFGERAAAECFEQRWESEEMNRLWGGVELHCGREECGRDEDLINATPFAAKIIAAFDVVVAFGWERSGV